MEKYVLLITNRYDFYDRHWVIRNTLEEAEKLATEYTKDHKFSVEIYKLESVDSVFWSSLRTTDWNWIVIH